MMARLASGTVRPSNWPELIRTPLSLSRNGSKAYSPVSPSPWATGMPWCLAPREYLRVTRAWLPLLAAAMAQPNASIQLASQVERLLAELREELRP